MAGSSAQFVKGSAQEHLLYITEKVNPILEALVTAVLLERPEDPSFFMLKWLCEQTKSLDGGGASTSGQGASTSEEIESVKAEIAKLKERKSQLLALKTGEKKEDKGDEGLDTKSTKSTKADDDEDEEEEDDDEDAPDMPPLPPPGMNRGPRQSVSAEAYGAWNKKDDNFVAPVYEKSEDAMKRIQGCLGSSFLFSSLEEEEMKTVILALKEKAVEPKTRIIQQGDDGNSMFIIEEGDVDCLKKIGSEEKVVKKCGPGDAFGELALLYNCPRAASVEAATKCLVWELDRETFNRIVKDSAAKKRTTYTEFLKKIPLFHNMDEYEMMTIADALKVESHETSGTQIIQQGETGDKFFIVIDGDCVAKKSFTPGSDPRQVMVHKSGDYFGELAIIQNEPRAASVFTSTDKVKLLSMERKTFKRLLGPIEDILRREAKRYE